MVIEICKTEQPTLVFWKTTEPMGLIGYRPDWVTFNAFQLGTECNRINTSPSKKLQGNVIALSGGLIKLGPGMGSHFFSDCSVVNGEMKGTLTAIHSDFWISPEGKFRRPIQFAPVLIGTQVYYSGGYPLNFQIVGVHACLVEKRQLVGNFRSIDEPWGCV